MMIPYPRKRQQVIVERQAEKLAAQNYDDPAKWKLTQITHNVGDSANWSFTERTYEMTPAYKAGIEAGEKGGQK